MAADGSIIIDTAIDTDELDRDLAGLKSNMTGIFKNLAKVAIAGTTAAAVAVTGFAVSATKDFANFQSGMNEVFTLMPDLSKDAMDSMTDDVKDFAKEMKVLPEDVVPALYQSISAGVPRENVFDFLETAQKAAKGGVTELATAVDGISSVVNAYGADIISATEASDLMFTAVKNGKTTFEEMSASLFNVIPTAASLGVEFGDVTAAIASLTAQGTPTSVATTQIRAALVELSKEGGKASDKFKELAGKSFKEFIAEGNNVQDALKIMEKGADDMGVGVNDLFSRVEAGNAVLALTGKGSEGFTKNLNDMANASGATETAYETMDQGINTAIESLKANFQTLKLEVGEQLAPVVEGLATKFADFVANEELVNTVVDTTVEALRILGDTISSVINFTQEIIEWIQEHETTVTLLAIAIGTLTTAIIAYNIAMGLGAVVTGVMTAASTAFGVVMAFITSPITLVILAIGALIAITVLIVKHWDEITAFFGQIWEDVKQIFFDSIERIKDWFAALPDFIREAFSVMVQIGADIVNGLWKGVQDKASWFKDKINGFFRGIVDGAKSVLGIHSPSVVFKKEVGNNIAAGVGVGFEEKFKTVDRSISGMMSGLVDSVSGSTQMGMQPAMATGTSTSTTNNFADMFRGANFAVRSEADINNIGNAVSRKIQKDKVSRARGNGRAR